MGRYIWRIARAAAVALLLFGGTILRLYTDWLWFKDVGFAAVFSRTLGLKLILFGVSAVAFFIIVYSNLRLARKIAPPPTSSTWRKTPWSRRMSDISLWLQPNPLLGFPVVSH